MKWFREKKYNLYQDNRGSTIIVVLVTMTLLTILASVLLYLSLVNLQMKRMDKAGKVNFYSAEAVMNEIRTGVQGTVSDAIKVAYTSILVNYKSSADDTLKQQQLLEFRETFFDNLYNSTIACTDGLKPLFVPLGASYNYDPSVLAAFVSDRAGVNISSGGAVELVKDSDDNLIGIILKAVTVEYVRNGYETTVTADIKIQAPDLPYTSTSSKDTAIPDFAIVARGTLQQLPGGGEVGIKGNVYAGNLTVNGDNNKFNVQTSPYFVVKNAVNVISGTLSLDMNSSLWARDIKLDVGGKINLAGDAYIANDLNLLGNDTQAVLSGRYYGYGNDLTDPDNSSSIIINGKNTRLDMNLRMLMLAGHSFINFGTDISTDASINVMMGESVSVKSNQMAYLVPDNCLKSGFSNPYKYTGTPPDPSVLQAAVLLDQKVNGKDLSTYGITSTVSNIAYIHKNVGTTNLIYFCFKFPNSDAANAYFKDYYNANGSLIQKYLSIYSDGILLKNDATKSLAGGAFTYDEGSLGPIISANGTPSLSIDEIKSSYKNLKVTLTRTDSGNGADSPYDYFVNEDEIKDNVPDGTTLTYPLGGTPKVAVINNYNYPDYIINADDNKTIHLIIATGNVTVIGEYVGLILAGGNITLSNGSINTANRTAVADALQALLPTGDGAKYYIYLNPQYISPTNVSTNTTATEIWDMNTLVSYENWAKNEK